VLYTIVHDYSAGMTNAGTESTDETEENNNAVLPQIGEDPGPSADIMEKDSKRKDREGTQAK
jgi:hypothetical protein